MTLALSLIGGLVILVLGAELLVRGAVRLAEGLGVSSLLIGLTVVGFGTSTPELVTSVQAALVGSPEIAVGNVVGSNLFNVLVILALAAVIAPIAVTRSALRRDGAVVLGTALLLVLVGWFWTLDRGVGAAFVLLLAGYLYTAYRQERLVAAGAPGGHGAAHDRGAALAGADPGLAPAPRPKAGGWLMPLGLALGGLVLLVVGARLFVGASIDLARVLGVSETVIGLTIVAAGTSMPELATSALAAFRRQGDVALGNILGSNVYNVLGIGGVTALISPVPVPPQIASFDAPVMLAMSAVLLVLLWTGLRLGRREGAALLAGYVAYVWWIWP